MALTTYSGTQGLDVVVRSLESARTLSGVKLTLVAQDGESNWLEGALLLAVYLVLGIAFFVGGTCLVYMSRAMLERCVAALIAALPAMNVTRLE